MNTVVFILILFIVYQISSGWLSKVLPKYVQPLIGIIATPFLLYYAYKDEGYLTAFGILGLLLMGLFTSLRRRYPEKFAMYSVKASIVFLCLIGVFEAIAFYSHNRDYMMLGGFGVFIDLTIYFGRPVKPKVDDWETNSYSE